MTELRIGIVGFGEVGRILAEDLLAAGQSSITTYDLRFDSPGDGLLADARRTGIACAADLAKAVRDQDIVFSAVTAASCAQVAEAASPHLGGAVFIDLNSVSPATKRAAASAVDAAGGRYVEAAVMAPFAPRRLRTSMLLGGPHARDFLPTASRLGLRADVFSDAVGGASAVKMCRSIFVKGLEAIVSECLVSARVYGVDSEVLSSLQNTINIPDWPERAKYLISRTLLHGLRRSEEMIEVVRTLEDVSLPAWMSQSAVARQAWAARLDIRDVEALTLEAMLDAIVAQADSARTAEEKGT